MPRYTYESLKVAWVVTITNIQAPTVAQLTAGTDLSLFIPVDGVDIPGTHNNASQAMLGGAFTTEEPGTWGVGPVTLTCVRDSTADTAWELFAGAYKTPGHIVIRRAGTGAFIATNKVEVYPVSSHEPTMLSSAENEYQKFEVVLPVTAAPALEAVVAA